MDLATTASVAIEGILLAVGALALIKTVQLRHKLKADKLERRKRNAAS